jgi:hypothetical protein
MNGFMDSPQADNQFFKQVVSPYREMAAYEALWELLEALNYFGDIYVSEVSRLLLWFVRSFPKLLYERQYLRLPLNQKL